jgi:hypothetical protein
MKRLIVLLALLVSVQARAEVQTWLFQGAELFADDGPFALITGPAGSLIGRFDYDTDTNTITAFLLDAGGAIFSSNTSEIPDCPLVRCTGSSRVETPSKLVFDQELTPAANERLELFLAQPLNSVNVPVTLDPSSVIYYDYGLATIHVVGGELIRDSAPLFNAVSSVPEPGTWLVILAALILLSIFGKRLR